MNWNPIRRSPIKKKPRKAYESAPWRRKKIRLDGPGMAKLRSEAFQRSGGYCECGCGTRVNWYDGQLHHVVSRGRGGSDVLSNVLFLTWPCHRKMHGKPEWGKSA